nr:unnamed protein product [Callosobruchus analis]
MYRQRVMQKKNSLLYTLSGLGQCTTVEY